MTFITASLLFSALVEPDQHGVPRVLDRVITSSPPRRTRGAAWSVLEQCWTAQSASGRTALVPMIRHLSPRCRRMSIVFLVSDFMTDEDLFDEPRSVDARRASTT